MGIVEVVEGCGGNGHKSRSGGLVFCPAVLWPPVFKTGQEGRQPGLCPRSTSRPPLNSVNTESTMNTLTEPSHSDLH